MALLPTRFRPHRYVRKRSHTVGQAPGEVVFVGDEPTAPVEIEVFDYNAEHFKRQTFTSIDEVFPYRNSPSVTWIDINGAHDTELIEGLGEHFGIHPLVLEDIANTSQRPKLEVYDRHLFAVLRMIRYDEATQSLDREQVSILVGDHYVISFQEEPEDVFDPVRARLEAGRGRIRQLGPDYLAYALIDMIVDHYFVVLERLGLLIEDLEDEVLRDPRPDTQEDINDLRRELVLMRRSVWPTRELFASLERTTSPLLTEEVRPFLRDAYDHAVQVIDIVESLREVVSSLTDLYMTGLSNKMNEIMKFLTIVGTIFIPLTFVAGIYGMNFDHMPELHGRYSYFIALGTMLLMALGLVMYFRKKRWL